MQNRYTGDIGDFGKYYLLKNIVSPKLKLGVNWYLVEHEESNNDGGDRVISYLSEKNKSHKFFKEIDAELLFKLKDLVDKLDRKVASVKAEQVLCESTIFYDEFVSLNSNRKGWFEDSIKELKDCDVIFCDPDNGFEIASCGVLSPKAPKYVFYHEVHEYYKIGKSLVIYQHQTRSEHSNEQVKARINEIVGLTGFSRDNITVLYYGKGTGRFYFVLLQEKHKKKLTESIERFLSDSKNKDLFRQVAC